MKSRKLVLGPTKDLLDVTKFQKHTDFVAYLGLIYLASSLVYVLKLFELSS